MVPKKIKGNEYSDMRGKLFYNNDFNASKVKRIYFIENVSTEFIRGWQGHRVEQRWFTSLGGSFKFWVQAIVDFENKIQSKSILEFVLDSKKLDVLHVPGGYITAIQALESNSKLLVMADHFIGEINDEVRFVYE
jgi:dTDP-4-dehydrorhamnose 3,5-epimerase-like enzyme